MNQVRIAIAGNPNSGKTTLFNALTGSNQHVGNWPGVTVELKEGSFLHQQQEFALVDLPGIYSFNAYSDDQRVSRDYLLSGQATVVLNVLDAANLERNLYLTEQILELGIPTVIVLNMWDLAQKRGVRVDLAALAERMGCLVVPVCAFRKLDLAAVREACARAVHFTMPPRLLPLPHGKDFSEAYSTLCTRLGEQPIAVGNNSKGFSASWIAFKLLEGDQGLYSLMHLESRISTEELDALRTASAADGEASEMRIAEERFRCIGELMSGIVQDGVAEEPMTARIDRLFLHRVLGVPIFLLAMYLVFWFTINVGGAFIDFFDLLLGAIFVDGVHAGLNILGAPGVIGVIVADGIGGGLQSLSTFIPVIFSMFFALSILEDSGYMARAAFIMDRFMRFLGLPGKAFVPLLVGFGCSVPAFMGTRTLEHRRDRILTMLMVPFMSCGAKMPVYALFAMAFFPHAGQNIIFLLYVIGILVAIATGLLLKSTVLKGSSSPLVMEMPAYHVPRMRNLVRHSWMRLKDFIFKGGRVLVPIMAILGILNSASLDGRFGNVPEGESVLASMGKAVTPLFHPFGIEDNNWQASVSLFTGFFAKEVVVGTLSGLYAQAAAKNALESTGPVSVQAPVVPWDLTAAVGNAFASIPVNLSGVLKTLIDPLGIGNARKTAQGDESVFAAMRAGFTSGTWGAFAFLLFILLYVPCMAATATAAREIGWPVTIFMVLYSTSLAWIAATLAYQISKGHDPFWIITPLLILVAFVLGLRYYGRRTSAV